MSLRLTAVAFATEENTLLYIMMDTTRIFPGQARGKFLIAAIVLSCPTQNGHAEIIPNAYIVKIAYEVDVGEACARMANRTGGDIGHVYQNAFRGFSIRVPPGVNRSFMRAQAGVLDIERDDEY